MLAIYPRNSIGQELQEVFAPEGESVTTKVITDRKTGKCRGFGFVTVLTDEQADQVIEKYNGLMFKENPLKIEKALPRSKGKSEKGEEDQQQSSPQSPQLVSASGVAVAACTCAAHSSARLPLPKVEEVLVKAIAVGVTTTSLAAISQQPRCRTPIPARCSQIRAGQALWKNSSKDWWKLRLLISRKGRLIAAVSRLWLTECIWKCDREPLKKPVLDRTILL
jgi:hypothetical protein